MSYDQPQPGEDERAWADQALEQQQEREVNTTTKTPTGLELLRAPFPAHQISKLPKPYKKDSPKGKCSECGQFHGLPAVHLDYVGHAALTDRLLDADPLWSWEPLAFDEIGLPRLDKSGGMWIRLTVCGVTRLGYGNAESKGYAEAGTREKELIGDALRNAAMRFGAALDLWHKGDLHLDDDDDPEPKQKVEPRPANQFMPSVVTSAAPPAESAPFKPASAGMKRTILAAMTRTEKTEAGLKEQFGFDLSTMPATEVNSVIKWAQAA